MILYIVRHGEPGYADEKNAPLTESGMMQAESAAEQLKTVGVNRIFSSPLKRAMKTASFSAQLINLPVETADFLSENNSIRYFLRSAADGNAHWMFEDIIRKDLYTDEIINAGKLWMECESFSRSS